MKYTVKFYWRGVVCSKQTLEAANTKLAFKYATKPDMFKHCVVIGQQITRFDNKGDEIAGNLIAYSINHQVKYPAIMVMIENFTEIYYFRTPEKRDEVFKCITSTSAESATTDQEQTDTIAYSEETDVSKSTLTSKKILNGCAMSATCQGKLIQDSTDKSSGTVKSKDMDTNTWLNGSTAYHLKRQRTLIATIHMPNLVEPWAWPGTNTTMNRMNGHTFEFKKMRDSQHGIYYKGKGYYWKAEWIDPNVVYAKVKDLPKGTKAREFRFPSWTIGKVSKFQLCVCGCGMYKDVRSDYYYHADWLDGNGFSRKDMNGR